MLRISWPWCCVLTLISGRGLYMYFGGHNHRDKEVKRKTDLINIERNANLMLAIGEDDFAIQKI